MGSRKQEVLCSMCHIANLQYHLGCKLPHQLAGITEIRFAAIPGSRISLGTRVEGTGRPGSLYRDGPTPAKAGIRPPMVHTSHAHVPLEQSSTSTLQQYLWKQITRARGCPLAQEFCDLTPAGGAPRRDAPLQKEEAGPVGFSASPNSPSSARG